jgi:hypothetical protein
MRHRGVAEFQIRQVVRDPETRRIRHLKKVTLSMTKILE